MPTERKKNELDRLMEEWDSAKDMLDDESLGYSELRDETVLPSGSLATLNYQYRNNDIPFIVKKESMDIIETGNELTNIFVEFYTGKERIRLPIDMWNQHKNLILSDETDIKDSKLIKDGDDFFFHFTVAKEAEIQEPEAVVGVDIGDKNLATSVALRTDKRVEEVEDVNFHGQEIRGIRRHYSYLKKQLQKKQNYQALKRISGKEQRRIDQLCHKTAKEIVEKAEKHNAAIVMENLNGIHGDTGMGKTMNRIVNEMPHHKLRKYIEYKALWKGIPVVEVDPRYTSQKCSCCQHHEKDRNHGNIECSTCGYEVNRDVNAAKNIVTGFSDQWFENGAVQPSAQKLTA